MARRVGGWGGNLKYSLTTEASQKVLDSPDVNVVECMISYLFFEVPITLKVRPFGVTVLLLLMSRGVKLVSSVQSKVSFKLNEKDHIFVFSFFEGIKNESGSFFVSTIKWVIIQQISFFSLQDEVISQKGKKLNLHCFLFFIAKIR